MAATKVQINWTGVSFTPTSGSTTSITRVTNASVGLGGALIKFKADTDIYPTVIANVNNDPHFSITTADVGTMMGFVPGTGGTLLATLNDAKLATDGAVDFTMINAVFENADTQAAHAQFGSVTGTWQAYSSDGQTGPLSFTRS
jgi:hypothetical protein